MNCMKPWRQKAGHEAELTLPLLLNYEAKVAYGLAN